MKPILCIILILTLLTPAIILITPPHVLCMSLDDDEEEDMEDVQDYLAQARKAADREAFSEADDYLKKARKFAVLKDEVKNTEDYVSGKRRAREERLAAQRREKEAARRRAAEKKAAAKRSAASSSSSSGSSSSCQGWANVYFKIDHGFSGDCAGSHSISITDKPSDVSVSNEGDHVILSAYNGCIRGSYGFSFTAKVGMACDRTEGHSGSFSLDGGKNSYQVVCSNSGCNIYGY